MLETSFTVSGRRRELATDDGNRSWRVVEAPLVVAPAETAVLLCDVWDHHWCRAAEGRLEPMIPTMNRVVAELRRRGVLVVHAPSETMAHYRDHPGRRRILESVSPDAGPAPAAPNTFPPLPIGVGAGQGCDTADGAPPEAVWTRQHPGIDIDPDCDVISDDGAELYQLYRQRDIATVIILGVHTNMCILDRSFAIKSLVGQGIRPVLVRDLTDAMYDPADPPYVSHAAGTALVVEYIEKFLCPTVAGETLLRVG